MLEPGASVRIYSGRDGLEDPPRAYYLLKENIWGNDGDTALLYDREGELVDTYRYP